MIHRTRKHDTSCPFRFQPMKHHEYEDDEWIDDDDDASECLVCPTCRAEVHEDTQQCPHCGDWITPVYPEKRIKSWVWKAAAVLVILALLMFAIG